MLFSLFSIVALLATATAAPMHRVEKRALPRLGGVNLAGCDFGMDVWGGSGTSYCPGPDQIAHFVSKGANLIRIPVGWQYLVGKNQASTSLDAGFFATYDALVQASLKAGAYVMIDLHNYGRWDGQLVGQGGPSNDALASLWKLVATKYKSEPKVIFGIMNEPHDVPDMTKWAATVQASVNAIRSAGATSQTIAIPGNFWSHADDWLNGGNAPLLSVKDSATGDNSLLILDVHKYLDGDGSGQSRECTTNGVDTWTALQSFLKTNKRQAIISEIGGGNTASCVQNLGQSLKFLADNPAEYNGFAIWSAGSFDSGYELSITPQNGQDTELFTKAVQPYLPGAGGAVVSPPKSSTSSAAPKPSTSSAAPKPSTSSAAPKPSTSSAAPKPSTSSVAPKPSTSSAAPKPSTSSAAPKPSSSAAAPKPSTSSAAPKPSTSSAAPKPSTSSAAPKPSTSSAAPKPSTSSAAAPKPSTSAAAPSPVAGNLQTYTGALGGIAAPAVTKAASGRFVSNGREFNFVGDALQGSCYAQMDLCQAKANASGNKGDVTVGACNGQVQACLAVAQKA